MPTIQVQLSDVKRQRGSTNIKFTATDNNNRQIERMIDEAEFDDLTWTSFAKWLIQQDVEWELLPEKEKSLEIKFHQETIEDEFGNEITVRVLDSVTVLG